MGAPRPELRKLREARGLQIKELAAEVGMSPDALGRIEAGKSRPQGENFRNLASSLRISFQRLSDILDGTYDPTSADQNGHSLVPAKFSLFIAAEAQARRVERYCDKLLEGILQTERYARHLIENERGLGPVTEQRIDLRLNRQKALTRKDDPLEYVAVIHEAALCVEVGDNRTMREQFEHLEWLAQLPNVELRVLPFSAGPCHLDFGGFHLLTLPYHNQPSIAYEEFYDGPSNKESEHYVSILIEAFKALLAMTLDYDQSLVTFDRMKRKYPI